MKKKILIADDQAHSRELLRIVLESEGYDVVEACDGAEALVKTRQQPPDLVLLDLQMPVLNCAAHRHPFTFRRAIFRYAGRYLSGG